MRARQAPRPPPQAHLAFEVRVFPRRERPLAPQRGSHPQGRRLFQAGPEGVETDRGRGDRPRGRAVSPRLGPRGSQPVQPPMVGPASTLPAPFPIWERCQVFGWGSQVKSIPRKASGSRALGRCWEGNSRASRAASACVPDTPVLGTLQPFCCPPEPHPASRKSPCSAHEVQPEGAGPGKASPPAWALPASAGRPPGCVMGAVLQPPFSRGVFIDELPRNSRPKRPRRV